MRLRAYVYAYGRLYIYGPLALEIERTNQANQEVTKPYKVTGYEPGGRNHLSLLYKLYFYFTIFQSLKNPNPYNYPWL
jgi:hypothetical protein